MSYNIGQYNHSHTIITLNNPAISNDFIALVPDGQAGRDVFQSDSSASESIVTNSFIDDYVLTSLTASKTYYFRCYIKRLSSEQVFDIQLTNYQDRGKSTALTQHLKTITVRAGAADEWINIEFIFTPLYNFDTILFKMQRTAEDFNQGVRCAFIGYQELGEIKNLLGQGGNYPPSPLLKIGIQSRPGFLMCINKEEIHTSRSGIYEIKNGVLSITFFSIVNAAKESTSKLSDWMQNIGAWSKVIEDKVAAGDMSRKAANEEYLTTEDPEKRSWCFFNFNNDNYPKTMEIDAFTLDYMYEE